MKKNNTQGKSYSICQTTQSAIQQQLKQFGLKNEMLKNNIKQQIDLLNSPKQVLTEKTMNRQITPNNINSNFNNNNNNLNNQRSFLTQKPKTSIAQTPTNNNKNKVSYISNKLTKIVDENQALQNCSNVQNTTPTSNTNASNNTCQQRFNFTPLTPLQNNLAKSPSTTNTNSTTDAMQTTQKNFNQDSSLSVHRASKQHLFSPSSRGKEKKSSLSPSPCSGISQHLLSPSSQTRMLHEDSNNNISTNSNTKCICVNCPDKKGKYYILMDEGDEDSKTYYCSRCSINLAQQGIKVISMEEASRCSLAGNAKVQGQQQSQQLKLISQPNNQMQNNIKPLNSNFDNNSNSQKNLIVNEEQGEQENLRKKELEDFSLKLQNLKNLSSQAKLQMQIRKNDLKAFYDKQIQKIDNFSQKLITFIDQEKNNAINKLKDMKATTMMLFKKHEDQSQQILKDLDDTYSDINQNVDKILKHMDYEPFQRILQQYDEKFTKNQQYINRLYQDNLTLVKLNYCSTKNYQKKIEEEIKPLIISLFSYLQTSTNLLKKDIILESESPNPLEKNKTKGSIYISFENKELFENAIKSSLSVENKNQGTVVLSIMNNGNLKTINTDNYDINADTNSDCSLYKEQQQKIINVSTTEPNIIKEMDEEEFKDNPKFLTEANEKENGLTSEESANKKDNLSNKYNNLLDKINSHQQQNKFFYDNVIKTALSSLPFSPQPTVGKDNLFQGFQTNIPKDNKQSDIFSTFLENKLKDEIDNSNNTNSISYQRTLFSSSPHFKDQDTNNNEENLLQL